MSKLSQWLSDVMRGFSLGSTVLDLWLLDSQFQDGCCISRPHICVPGRERIKGMTVDSDYYCYIRMQSNTHSYNLMKLSLFQIMVELGQL